MKYRYFPGCSMEHNAITYHESLSAVVKKLGIELTEIEDWSCCGAKEFFSLDLLSACSLVGRNLAIASTMGEESHDLVTPCSACYLNLVKTDYYMATSEELNEKVNIALAEGELNYKPGTMKIRHFLDIIVNDVGYDLVEAHVKKPLYSLKVAPYYGCLVSRPGSSESYDDPEHPTSLDKLMRIIGADVVNYPLKTQCCSAHMTQIKEDVGLKMIHLLLQAAEENGADVIVTICPMCQFNLDAYQKSVNKKFGTNFHIPILFFTQLMGLAFDMGEEIGLGRELVDASFSLDKITAEPPEKEKPARAKRTEIPMPLSLGEEE